MKRQLLPVLLLLSASTFAVLQSKDASPQKPGATCGRTASQERQKSLLWARIVAPVQAIFKSHAPTFSCKPPGRTGGVERIRELLRRIFHKVK